MADHRAAVAAVQTEQRHQVDHGQCRGRHLVEIGEIGRVEVGRGHQVSEETLVDVIASAGAELVVLDGHYGSESPIDASIRSSRVRGARSVSRLITDMDSGPRAVGRAGSTEVRASVTAVV